MTAFRPASESRVSTHFSCSKEPGCTVAYGNRNILEQNNNNKNNNNWDTVACKYLLLVSMSSFLHRQSFRLSNVGNLLPQNKENSDCQQKSAWKRHYSQGRRSLSLMERQTESRRLTLGQHNRFRWLTQLTHISLLQNSAGRTNAFSLRTIFTQDSLVTVWSTDLS